MNRCWYDRCLAERCRKTSISTFTASVNRVDSQLCRAVSCRPGDCISQCSNSASHSRGACKFRSPAAPLDRGRLTPDAGRRRRDCAAATGDCGGDPDCDAGGVKKSAAVAVGRWLDPIRTGLRVISHGLAVPLVCHLVAVALPDPRVPVSTLCHDSDDGARWLARLAVYTGMVSSTQTLSRTRG